MVFLFIIKIGQQLTLKDNHLVIEPSAWLKPIGEHYPSLHESYLKVGTNKKADSKQLEPALAQIFETWRGVVTSIGTILHENILVFIAV